jgi:hypothetical protein
MTKEEFDNLPIHSGPYDDLTIGYRFRSNESPFEDTYFEVDRAKEEIVIGMYFFRPDWNVEAKLVDETVFPPRTEISMDFVIPRPKEQ